MIAAVSGVAMVSRAQCRPDKRVDRKELSLWGGRSRYLLVRASSCYPCALDHEADRGWCMQSQNGLVVVRLHPHKSAL